MKLVALGAGSIGALWSLQIPGNQGGEEAEPGMCIPSLNQTSLIGRGVSEGRERPGGPINPVSLPSFLLIMVKYITLSPFFIDYKEAGINKPTRTF